MKWLRWWMIVLVVMLIIGVWQFTPRMGGPGAFSPIDSGSPYSAPSPSFVPVIKLFDPIAGWKSRITKKNFGTYVNPKNSPVSPEKFTGYHTAVDIEYGDVTDDVSVFAITDGEVLVSRFASGYGGVILMKHTIDGRELFVVYGHLRVSSMPAVGTKVTGGEQIGLLGTAYSTETDGERRHLHFGVAIKNSILGYVPSLPEANAGWINPLSLYQ